VPELYPRTEECSSVRGNLTRPRPGFPIAISRTTRRLSRKVATAATALGPAGQPSLL
jgi:hypothetical protein